MTQQSFHQPQVHRPQVHQGMILTQQKIHFQFTKVLRLQNNPTYSLSKRFSVIEKTYAKSTKIKAHRAKICVTKNGVLGFVAICKV